MRDILKRPKNTHDQNRDIYVYTIGLVSTYANLYFTSFKKNPFCDHNPISVDSITEYAKK